jgi:hypothetical protein
MPPKPLPALSPLLPEVRLAPAFPPSALNKETAVIREVPQYRMVGAITGSTGRFALIEGINGQLVVKPGDKVEGYTVTEIDRDSVVLERTINGETIQQIIPLSDTIPGRGANPMGGPGGGPGGPGYPGGGMYPGGGGYPGGGMPPGYPGAGGRGRFQRGGNFRGGGG